MRAVAVCALCVGLLVTQHWRSEAHSAPRCLQRNVPEKILGELYKMSVHARESLPRDDNQHHKLLPKFPKSLKKTKGIGVIKEIVDFYFSHVFSVESLNIPLQEETLNYLSRLKKEVDHCFGLHPSALSSAERNMFRSMQETFTKLQTPGVYKAVAEFKTVLVWIDAYMHQEKHVTRSTRKLH